MAESTTSTNSHINLEAKLSGKPVAGKRHDGFDEAGVGNVSKGAGLRASAKALELPPYPKVNAPVLDPTSESPYRRRLQITCCCCIKEMW